MDRIDRPTARRTSRALRASRAEADDRIGSRCDIVGSMIGVKVRRGKVLPRLCLTYLVREKIELNQLSPRNRIPSRLSVAGKWIPTDVLEWPRMELHGLQQGRFIRDGYTQGTLTVFAESNFGLWGMSCGHCMLGTDQKPYSSAEIYMQDNASGQFIPAGSTGQVVFASGGKMICNSRGYIDCGLFSLDDDSLLARAQASSPLATVDLDGLAHQQLVGVSTMTSGGMVGGKRMAQVIGIDQFGIDDYSDVVLQVGGPGMVHGDSGMLWLTADGRAAAIHCRGEIISGDQGSHLVTAMSARRAAEVLNVRLRRA